MKHHPAQATVKRALDGYADDKDGVKCISPWQTCRSNFLWNPVVNPVYEAVLDTEWILKQIAFLKSKMISKMKSRYFLHPLEC